ncbi:MAG TPA: cupin domain-containing protein [Gemmatimonadales bacterium]|nr:cupin domain-containing protein [Gemmatimonadales bacterium]
MNLYDSHTLAREAVARPGRPGFALAHDHADARLVVFRIDPGQQVAPHTSPASVFLVVTSGSGFISGADGERAVAAGAIAAFAPGERHGMRAAEEQLVIAAFIAPGPGGR